MNGHRREVGNNKIKPATHSGTGEKEGPLLVHVCMRGIELISRAVDGRAPQSYQGQYKEDSST